MPGRGNRCHRLSLAVSGLIFVGAIAMGQQAASGQARHISASDRHDAQVVLGIVRDDIKANYYDPTFHGLDLQARYEEYSKRIEDAPNLGAALRVIEAYVAGLHDTHTVFLPPRRAYQAFYGFDILVVGSHCYVTAVRPGYDAASKLRLGDDIVSLDGFTVDRNDYAALLVTIKLLEPQPALHLVVRDQQGVERAVDVQAKIVKNSALVLWDNYIRQAQEEAVADNRQGTFVSGNVLVWKVPNFTALPGDYGRVFKEARGHAAMVVDLRGNPGGDLDVLKNFLGYFVAQKTQVAELVKRKGREPIEVKPHGEPYKGRLVVVVDSTSASAAELFARTVQLEHLGAVVGSVSAGAVMAAEMHFHASGEPFSNGEHSPWGFGDEVTGADVVMTDGHSLEHAGVIPDIVAEPTAADLSAGRDVVLARAVAAAGGSADPVALAKAFPVRWPPDNGN